MVSIYIYILAVVCMLQVAIYVYKQVEFRGGGGGEWWLFKNTDSCVSMLALGLIYSMYFEFKCICYSIGQMKTERFYLNSQIAIFTFLVKL